MEDEKTLNQKIENIVYSHYYKYSKDGKLSGEDLKKFIKDYSLEEHKGSSFENFKKHTFDNFKKVLDFFQFISEITIHNEKTKNVELQVEYSEKQKPSTLIEANLLVNNEEKNLLLSDLYPKQKKQINDNLAFIIKIKTTDSKKLKEKFDSVYKFFAAFIKLKEKKFPIYSFVLDYDIEDNENMILAITINHPLINYFKQIFLILSEKMKGKKIDAKINLKLLNTFKQLIDDPSGNNLTSLIKGSCLSATIISNCVTDIIDFFIKIEKEKGGSHQSEQQKINEILIYLALLVEFNVNVSMKMEELEMNYFWNKLPNFNIFSEENSDINSALKDFEKFKDSLPIVKKVIELLQEIDGKVECALNTPVFYFRLKLEGKGFFDVLDLLQMIHN